MQLVFVLHALKNRYEHRQLQLALEFIGKLEQAITQRNIQSLNNFDRSTVGDVICFLCTFSTHITCPI